MSDIDIRIPAAAPARDDTAGLTDAILRALDRETVTLRGQQWRATIDGPDTLTLTQWVGDEGDTPSGPKVRATITIRIKEGS